MAAQQRASFSYSAPHGGKKSARYTPDSFCMFFFGANELVSELHLAELPIISCKRFVFVFTCVAFYCSGPPKPFFLGSVSFLHSLSRPARSRFSRMRRFCHPIHLGRRSGSEKDFSKKIVCTGRLNVQLAAQHAARIWHLCESVTFKRSESLYIVLHRDR